jgi:antirestriction protein ArdC
MSPKADAYKVVTDRIIEALDAGIVPWHKPWKSVAGSGPTSMQTGREYRGINVWILSVTSMLRGYSSPYWLTFKQAKERGGSVRKGEKGTQVVLWKPVRKEVETEGGETETQQYLVLRYFTVFNLEQCDGIEAPASEPLPERDPIEACEEIVTGYVPGPDIRHGGNSAYYSPALDFVQMPQRGQFDTSEHYYGTLFHELAHSTGHESRLKRDTLISPKPFGSEDYSKEELTAEMTAALLCGEAGIEVNVQHHASYVANWLEALRNDRKLLVQAAARAQKAADLVLGVQPVKNGEEEPNNGSPRSAGGCPMHSPERRNHEKEAHACQRSFRLREDPSTREAGCQSHGSTRSEARMRTHVQTGRRRSWVDRLPRRP